MFHYKSIIQQLLGAKKRCPLTVGPQFRHRCRAEVMLWLQHGLLPVLWNQATGMFRAATGPFCRGSAQAKCWSLKWDFPGSSFDVLFWRGEEKKQNHDFWWWSQWCFIGRCWSPLLLTLLTWPGWPWHCRGRWQNAGSPGQRDPLLMTHLCTAYTLYISILLMYNGIVFIF